MTNGELEFGQIWKSSASSIIEIAPPAIGTENSLKFWSIALRPENRTLSPDGENWISPIESKTVVVSSIAPVVESVELPR